MVEEITLGIRVVGGRFALELGLADCKLTRGSKRWNERVRHRQVLFQSSFSQE